MLVCVLKWKKDWDNIDNQRSEHDHKLVFYETVPQRGDVMNSFGGQNIEKIVAVSRE